jgi:hypothetical protein
MKYVNYDNLETAKEMIKAALDKKVDKESGKGLSTNDYTNEEKNKLAGIEEEANKTIVDSELNLESTNPVENKVVSEELNTKANKVEVEEALDTKADKVDVEEALNTKADKIAVEEALKTKADKQEVAEALDTKVDKESGKGLSTNDFTNEEKEKLSKLDIKSNENIIEVIKQNGEVLEIHDKSVNIVTITEDTIDNKIENAVKNVEVELTDYAKRSDIPKNVSDLFNDKAFISSSDEKDPTVPAHVKAITEEDIEKWNSGTGSGSGNETCNVVVDAVEPSNGEAIWIKLAKNLCHFNNVKNEYSINSAGKVVSDYMWNKWLTTDFIEVEPDTVYTLSGILFGTNSRYNAWYDSNKNPISAFVRYIPTGQSSQTVTSPSNAKYIRFSIYNGYDDARQDERVSFQFEKGSEATSYAPYSGKSDMFVKNSNGEYEQIYEAFPVPLPENEQYTLPAATATTLGGIKVGNNLTVDADGTLHAQASGGGVSEETDPTVPAHVKAITEEDIDKWNSGAGGGETPSIITICNQSSNLSVTVSSSWTPYEIPLTQLSTNMGDVFTHENGTIKVNRDCTALVSSSTLVKFIEDEIINVLIYVIRNGSRLLISNGYIITANWQTVSISPVVYDFLKGDIIQMYIECGATGTLGVGNGKGAQITVQKINETNIISGGDISIDVEDAQNNILTATLPETITIAETNVSQSVTSFVETSKIGDKFSVENGVIKVGAGVTKVKISYSACMQSSKSTTGGFTYLIKNGSPISQEAYTFNSTWQVVTNIIPPVVVDVVEGDTISLLLYGYAGNSLLGNSDRFVYKTNITIEEVHETNIIAGGNSNIVGETKDSLQIGVTKNNTLTISNAWSLSKIPFDAIKIQSGDNLTFTTDGHIKIGKNISKVRVLGNLLANSSAIGTMDMRIYVLRNGTAINSGATYISLDKLKDYRTALLELPVLEVQENDELYITITSDVACTFTIADNAYLYVEKILDTNVIAGGAEKPVVLFESEEGSSGPITLSKSLSEFKYVEIFYSYLGNTWGYDYTKIEDPDGKLTNLTVTVLNNSKIYTSTSTWSLNGTEVVRTKGERFRFDTTPVITRAENADDIVINKIIGHYSDSSSGGGTTNTVEKLSKVLYEDNTGSTTSVTLSETSANFKYMEIYCKSGDSTYTSVKVHEPNGKRVTATSGWFGSAAYFKNSVIDIIDDQVIFVAHNASEITGKNLSNTVGLTKESASAMSIVKVVGYYDEPSFIGGSGGGNIDLSNYVTKEELPTKVSELENDSNYINKIKTINGQSLVGNGNIVIAGGGDGSGDGLPEVSVGVDTPGMGESLWLKTRENLFNKDTITPDVYINEAGELATHVSWNVSDFISVEPGVSYTWRNVNSYGSAAYFGCYDADKTLVSLIKQEIGENTIIIPDGACYIRLCMADFDLDTFLFEQCSSEETFDNVLYVKRTDGTYQKLLNENKPEIMTIELTADTSMSIGSAWTRYTIPFDKITTRIGDNLSMTSEGKIKIGKGIKAICINTTMLYGSSLSMIEIAARYKRGTTTKNICVAYTKGGGASTYYTLANVYPAFVVQEGDEIDFAITAASSGTVSVQKEGTFLCVQKIV